jgi:anti-sigma factor RsiW
LAHRVWQSWLDAYAEGSLPWPLTVWVERHTKRCQACRQELRSQLSFMNDLDSILLGHDEMVNTVALATGKELALSDRRRLFNPKFSMLLSGAAACVVLVIMLSMAISTWFGTGVTVVAASGWSSGVATTVPVDGSLDMADTVLTSPSGVGVGSGVSIPVAASEEWSG